MENEVKVNDNTTVAVKKETLRRLKLLAGIAQLPVLDYVEQLVNKDWAKLEIKKAD